MSPRIKCRAYGAPRRPRSGRPSGMQRTASLARRLLSTSGASDPARIDRMLGANELQICRLTLGVCLEGAPQSGDDLRRLRHILGVKALRSGHGGHAGLIVIGDRMGIGVMPTPPEPWAVS